MNAAEMPGFIIKEISAYRIKRLDPRPLYQIHVKIENGESQRLAPVKKRASIPSRVQIVPPLGVWNNVRPFRWWIMTS